MKNFKILFFLIFTGLLYSSCESYFDDAIPPSNVLTDNWSRNEDLEKLTVSSYYFWQGYKEGIGDLGIVIPSFTSDEGVLSTENDQLVEYGNQDQLYNRRTSNNTIPYLARVWQSGYEVVRTSNIVINHLNEFGAFEDSNAAWEDRMKGENYFCRAFAFYTLIKIFAPPYNSNSDMSAPGIIINTTNSEGALDNKPLNSIQEAYDQVISDLNNAIKYLPEEYDPNRDPETYQDRAKNDAARFLLARVYFQMGPEFWELALEQINYLIDTGKYSLAQNPAEAFMQQGLGNISNETIFQYAAYSDRSKWRIPTMYFSFDGGSGNRRRVLEMSTDFIEYFGWNDEIIAQNDRRFNNVFVKRGSSIWANKWKTVGDNSALMRLPELYLNRAIITLLTGMGNGNTQAISDLNNIRSRAYVNYTPLDNSYTTNELIDICHKERSKELFLEGDRLYYMQALRANVPCGDRGDNNCLAFDSSQLYWPIPEREINLNNNL